MTRLIVTAMLAVGASGSAALESPPDRTLAFDVLLEGKPVGSHRYEFRSTETGGRAVLSVAEFKVKFLFFTAYSYEHRAEERWQDDCLVEIDAKTNSNGSKTDVEGRSSDDGFVVRTDGERELLTGCVMTFAYWNRAFLEQPRLLNPQTGRYLEVDVQKLEPQPVELRGEAIETTRYRITARDMNITVFYSDDGEWVALESTVEDGRILRYEIS